MIHTNTNLKFIIKKEVIPIEMIEIRIYIISSTNFKYSHEY